MLLKTITLLCLVALPFALQACSKDPGSGDVRVGVSTAALTADVTRVELTVSGAGISPDIVQGLTQDPADQAIWNTVDPLEIPTGADRVFTARGYDAADVLLYEGSATTDVVEATNPTVLIILNQLAPTGFSNVAPRFTSLVLDANPVQPGQLVQMTADASDPDQATGLTYDWSATGGSFETAQGSTVTWTAPTTAGDYLIAVSVTDSDGARSKLEFTMTVQVGPAGTGTASLSGEVNNAPVVINLTASDGQVDAGETVNLSLDVTDPEGDPMSFDWSAGCDGTFSDATAQNPSFTLNTLPAGDPPADCTVSVEISDARGATNSASLSLATGPDVCEAGGCPKSAGGSGPGVSAPTGLVYALQEYPAPPYVQALDMDGLEVVEYVKLDLDDDPVTLDFHAECFDVYGGIAWLGADDGRVAWVDVLARTQGVAVDLGDELIEDIVVGTDYVWALHRVPRYDELGVLVGWDPQRVRISPATLQTKGFWEVTVIAPDTMLLDGDRLWVATLNGPGARKDIAAYDSSSGAFVGKVDFEAFFGVVNASVEGLAATSTSLWVRVNINSGEENGARKLIEFDRDLLSAGSPIDLSAYNPNGGKMAATEEAVFLAAPTESVLKYDMNSGAVDLFDVSDPDGAVDRDILAMTAKGNRLFLSFYNWRLEVAELATITGDLGTPMELLWGGNELAAD